LQFYGDGALNIPTTGGSGGQTVAKKPSRHSYLFCLHLLLKASFSGCSRCRRFTHHHQSNSALQSDRVKPDHWWVTVM